MSDLPQGWTLTTFGELFDFKGGSQPPKSTFRDTAAPGYVRLLQIRDFESDAKAVFIKDHHKWPKCSAEDIMIGRYGASVGKILGGKAGAYNVALVRMIFDHDSLHPGWVKQLLRSDYFQNPLANISRSAQNGFNKSDLAPINVPLPPLPEQRRIVAKIDSLTGKSRRARDHLDHIPRLVEKYKQAILTAAFRGDLCTNRRSPKLLPLSEFIDSLDQGWSPKCASEPAGLNDWGVIKTTAIQSVHFLPQENKRLPTDLKPRPGIVINAGDVLTTRAGPRSRVAISCLVNEDHPKLMLCDKAYRLRINQEMADPAFVTYMLNTSQCLSELEVMKTGISDSGLNLTQGKFIALGIPAFSLPEQSEIVRRIQSAFVWIDRLAADANSARKLIDHLDQSVLAKAFKGELVPQDPADEPASALLERIRAERAAAPKAKRGRKKAA